MNCKVCDKPYKTRNGLYKHSLKCLRKEYNCPHCRKIFLTKSYFENHVSTCQEETDSRNCPLCEKTFSTKRYLKKHIELCKNKYVKIDNDLGDKLLEGLDKKNKRIIETIVAKNKGSPINITIQNIHNDHSTKISNRTYRWKKGIRH